MLRERFEWTSIPLRRGLRRRHHRHQTVDLRVDLKGRRALIFEVSGDDEIPTVGKRLGIDIERGAATRPPGRLARGEATCGLLLCGLCCLLYSLFGKPEPETAVGLVASMNPLSYFRTCVTGLPVRCQRLGASLSTTSTCVGLRKAFGRARVHRRGRHRTGSLARRRGGGACRPWMRLSERVHGGATLGIREPIHPRAVLALVPLPI